MKVCIFTFGSGGYGSSCIDATMAAIAIKNITSMSLANMFSSPGKLVVALLIKNDFYLYAITK